MRQKWPDILDHAREIMDTYTTPITLRQLFYRLVADQTITNTESNYHALSDRTARAREAGTFPDFIDQGRSITQSLTFENPSEAVRDLARYYYRRDRTAGQAVTLMLGVEKRGIVAQLSQWFGVERGIPIVPLGGFSSVTLIQTICAYVERYDRPAVMLYSGDFDPSGEIIDSVLTDSVLIQETGLELERICLNESQIAEYDLPVNAGKPGDPRAAAFVERYREFHQRHGVEVAQVELDALPPDVLKGLYADAIEKHWDEDVYTSVLGEEAAERDRLIELAESMG